MRCRRSLPCTAIRSRPRFICVAVPDPVYGWSHNLYEVEKVIARVREEVDHRLLNDFIEAPSLENVAQWLWKRFKIAGSGAGPSDAQPRTRRQHGRLHVFAGALNSLGACRGGLSMSVSIHRLGRPVRADKIGRGAAELPRSAR